MLEQSTGVPSHAGHIVVWLIGGRTETPVWKRSHTGQSVLGRTTSGNADQGEIEWEQHLRILFRGASPLPQVVQVFLPSDLRVSLLLGSGERVRLRRPELPSAEAREGGVLSAAPPRMLQKNKEFQLRADRLCRLSHRSPSQALPCGFCRRDRPAKAASVRS